MGENVYGSPRDRDATDWRPTSPLKKCAFPRKDARCASHRPDFSNKEEATKSGHSIDFSGAEKN